MTWIGRLSPWGIASLLLLVGAFGFGQYNLYLYDQHRAMLLGSWTAVHRTCAVVCFASVVCGVVATRRQSALWLLLVGPAAWMALVCFLDDL